MAPAVITASSASLLRFRPPSSRHPHSSSAVFRCPPSSLSFRVNVMFANVVNLWVLSCASELRSFCRYCTHAYCTFIRVQDVDDILTFTPRGTGAGVERISASPQYIEDLRSRRGSFMTRSKDLILEGCTTTYWLKKKGVDFACKSQGKSCLQTTTDRFPLFHEHQAGPLLTTPTDSGRSKSKIRREAYKYNSFGFRVPSNAEKPDWWWRTLSCVPYLVALWVSNAGFFLSPLLENFKYFEDVVFYIPGALTPLPAWFHMVYYYLALGLVVKNKEWPLLFRFNVMMGLLLETALQVVWYSANFLPIIHYNGTLGMYFWAGVALAYILLMLKCIRCALLGTFVKIPLISESAFIHSLFHIGGFQRPF